MRDLRRRVLENTGKTVSKKAQRSSRPASTTTSRTNSRAASRHNSDDEDGELSDSTNWSTNSIDEMLAGEPVDEAVDNWQQTLDDRMEEIIDRKRSSVQGRETSLAQYCYLLMSKYSDAQISPKMGELIPAFLKSIKVDSSEKETSLALRALALTLITTPSETAYDSIEQTVKRLYTHSEHVSVKAAGIHALAAAAIYGGAGDDEIEEVMDNFLEVIESDGSSIEAEDMGDVVTAAAEAWGFLCTYIDDMEDKTEPAMEAFVEQLESSDAQVQVAVGENIALLFEKSYTEREANDEAPADDQDEEGNPIDNHYVKRYEVYRQKAQLEHTLLQLSKESSRRIAKKDRKSLHTHFADILNSVEHPTRGPKYQNAINHETGQSFGSRMVVRIHKTGAMRVDKWWKLHRLQALRRILGGGFVTHYTDNEVVFETLPIMLETGK